MKKYLTCGLLALAGLPFTAFGLQINEIRIDEPGDDLNEYFELKGEPGSTLDDVWYLVVGDHSGSGASKGSGVVEYALDLSGLKFPDTGLMLVTSNTFGLAPDNLVTLRVPIIFENSDNVTHLLVSGYTGSEVLDQADQVGTLAVDIDANDDGIVDNIPWTSVIDAIGLVESPSEGEFFYGVALGFVDVGPDGTFTPGHVYRASDNNLWLIGDFDITPEAGSLDSPGEANPFAFTVYGVNPLHGAEGDKVTVSGVSLNTTSLVTVGGVSAEFAVLSDSMIEVTIPVGAVDGIVAVTTDFGQREASLPFDVVASNVVDLFYENFSSEGLGQAIQFSVSSDKNWVFGSQNGNGYATMNGFQADTASDDWLIVGPIALIDITEPMLHFYSARNFDGPDLAVKISTDYSGSGSPASATWASLSATLSPEDYIYTSSGPISLSAYEGQSVYIAFQYTSSSGLAGAGATYEIDEIWVSGVSEIVETPTIFGAYELGFGYRIMPIGFLYDEFFPFVWSANASAWWWIYDVALDGTDNSYYFYSFGTGYWGYTSAQSFYPFYVEFNEANPNGEIKQF